MRYLLAGFFFLIYAGDNVGLAMSLAPGLSIKNLVLYLVLTGIAINAAVARNRKVEMTGVLVMFSLLILYAFFTWLTLSFVIRDPEYQVRAGFISLKSNLVDQFLTFLIFFYGLMHLKDAIWVLRAIIWIVMLGNVVTIIDTMNIPDLGLLPTPRKQGRFEGFLGQPNEYGQFLAFFLPACIAVFLNVSGKLRMLAGICVFSSLLALVLTGSRGAYAGVLVGAIIASFYLRQYIAAQTVVRAATTATVTCTVVIVITFLTGYADLMLSRFSGIEGTAHVATSGRSSLWSNALESMMENPVTFVSGYGFHSYASSRTFRLATHNTYLSYLYNLGSVGLLLFVAIFARILAAARNALANAPQELRYQIGALVFGLFSFLIATFFSEYHATGYLLWAYTGVVLRVGLDLSAANAAEPSHAPVARGDPVAPVRPYAAGLHSRDLRS